MRERFLQLLRFPILRSRHLRLATVSLLIVFLILFFSKRQTLNTDSGIRQLTLEVKGSKTSENKIVLSLLTPTPIKSGQANQAVATKTSTPTVSISAAPAQSGPTLTTTPLPALTSAPASHIETGHLPTLGSSSKVVIVEFSDFQCPYCKSFYDQTLGRIKSDYVDSGKATFAYRQFPLSIHANAQKAAEASECANEKGKFWDYHNKLFGTQVEWASRAGADAINAFADYASQVGLDSAEFKTCIESGKFAGNVSSDMSYGQSQGAGATPTVFINNQKIVGAQPYDTFKAAIEQELAK